MRGGLKPAVLDLDPDTKSVVWVFDDGMALTLESLAIDDDALFVAPHPSDVEIYALLYPATLDELDLRGPLRAAVPPEPERSLPPASRILRAVEARYEPLDALPERVAQYRIPALSLVRCIDAGGCLAPGSDAQRCTVPCESALPSFEPMPPAPANAVADQRHDCPAGSILSDDGCTPRSSLPARQACPCMVLRRRLSGYTRSQKLTLRWCGMLSVYVGTTQRLLKRKSLKNVLLSVASCQLLQKPSTRLKTKNILSVASILSVLNQGLHGFCLKLKMG